MFPDSAFVNGEICGVSVRALNPESELEDVQSLLRLVEEGIIKLVRQNLLASAEVLILSPKDEQVLERYFFTFSNVAERDPASLQLAVSGGKEEVLVSTKERECKDSVRIMLRKLLVTTDALDDLVKGCKMAFRLIYKDNAVPPEFEPKYFQTGGHNLVIGVRKPLDLNLGQVQATGHSMDFIFQANPEQLRQDSEDGGEPSSSPAASVLASSPAGTEPQHKRAKR